MRHELGVHQIELEMQNEQLRLTQAALEASRDRYASLYAHAPMGYLTLRTDGVVLEGNHEAGLLAGVTAQQLAGQRLTNFIASDDRPRLQQCMAALARGHGPQSIELRLDRPHGNPRWVALQLARLGDKEAPQWLVTMFDISERMVMQEGLSHLAAIVSSSDDAII